VAYAHQTQITEVRRTNVAGEVNALQVPYFVAPQPPSIKGLESDRVTPSCQRAFAAGIEDPFRFEVVKVEELL
jgi:hypothetical protein